MHLLKGETPESAAQDIEWCKQVHTDQREEALTKLYNRWSGIIILNVRRFVRGSDDDRWEDYKAAGALGLINAAERYKPSTISFGMWAGTIIRHFLNNEYRMGRLPSNIERGKEVIPMDPHEFTYDLHMPKVKSHDRVVLNKIQAEQALASLNLLEKTICKAVYYEDITFKEIGEILSLSGQRVSYIHQRALRKMLRNICPCSSIGRAALL